ncbi:cAMP phosphodiesterases class-II-domain-containing protein [Xylaria nigripes]|nr:cAMP phosphodiesterases class-II-domain-containing protein [Xylaria nigripes]
MSTSASTNAGYVTRHLIDTYLITHPHLDHISGFVINTAGLPGTRPKRLAEQWGWLVTYMRLVEGGSPALGEGDGKGYLEITEGLGVKIFGISHGHCIERHAHRGSTAASGPPSLFKTSAAMVQDKDPICVYDSSAYFIRDNDTGREILMKQQLALRTETLAAIFIECSYDNSQSDDRLFGHLSPRYVIQEMQALGFAVEMARQASRLDLTKKRKRELSVTNNYVVEVGIGPNGEDRPLSPKSGRPAKKGPVSMTSAEQGGTNTPHLPTAAAEMSLADFECKTKSVIRTPQFANALKGLKVVIIHIKEKLVDGDDPGDIILEQLLEAEEEAQLGCEFVISGPGQSFLL